MDTLFSLEDLKPSRVTIHIETDYGRVLDVPVVLPTTDQWDDEGRAIIDPKVPLTLADPNDPDRKLPNRNDSLYLEKLAAALRRRLAYRLACALERAGVNVPGESVIEKADEVLKMDNGIFQALAQQVIKSSVGAERARVESLAAGFSAESNAETEDDRLPVMEHQAVAVVVPSANGQG